jgi:phage-related protein
MTYPIIPLTPTWGNPETETADIAKTKYGEVGVEKRTTKGINTISSAWDISVNIYNFAEVDTFLRTRRGLPFRLSLDGGATDDGKLYICKEWSIQQQGDLTAAFSGKFEQVRRFL